MRDKRLDLLNHAIELFALQGYDATSTNQIIEQANVSKGLLFHYFTNKETLFLRCYQIVSEDFHQHLLSIDHPSTSFKEELFKLALHKHAYGIEKPLYYQLLFEGFVKAPLHLQPQLQQILTPIMEDGMKIMHTLIDTLPIKATCSKQDVYLLFEGINYAFQKNMIPSITNVSTLTTQEITGLYEHYVKLVDGILYGILA